MSDLSFLHGNKSILSSSNSISSLPNVQKSDKSWENLILTHQMHTYGISKEECLRLEEETAAEEVSCCQNQGQKQSRSPGQHGGRASSGEEAVDLTRAAAALSASPATAAGMPPLPSARLKSPVASSRRLVDRLVCSYDSSHPCTPVSAKKRNKRRDETQSSSLLSPSPSRSLSGRSMNSKDVIGQEGGVDEKPRCSAALYDWSCSPLARIALEGEEDAAAAEMDGLLKKVRQVRSRHVLDVVGGVSESSPFASLAAYRHLTSPHACMHVRFLYAMVRYVMKRLAADMIHGRRHSTTMAGARRCCCAPTTRSLCACWDSCTATCAAPPSCTEPSTPDIATHLLSILQ
jgi:hypothetical protein